MGRHLHVSTAYVAGRYRGRFKETDLDLGQGFRNTYEQSKFEAEKAIAEAADGLPLVIARPSIIVGDSRSGWTSAFNVIYWPMRAFSRGLMDEVAIDPDGGRRHRPDRLRRRRAARAARRTSEVARHRRAGRRRRRADQRRADRAGLPPVRPRAAADRRRLLLAARGRRSSTRPTSASRRASTTPARASCSARSGSSAPLLRDYFATLIEYAERARWGKTPDHARGRAPRRCSGASVRSGAGDASDRLYVSMQGWPTCASTACAARLRRAREPAGLPRAARRDHRRPSWPPASASPRTSWPSASPSAARRSARR